MTALILGTKSSFYLGGFQFSCECEYKYEFAFFGSFSPVFQSKSRTYKFDLIGSLAC